MSSDLPLESPNRHNRLYKPQPKSSNWKRIGGEAKCLPLPSNQCCHYKRVDRGSGRHRLFERSGFQLRPFVLRFVQPQACNPLIYKLFNLLKFFLLGQEEAGGRARGAGDKNNLIHEWRSGEMRRNSSVPLINTFAYDQIAGIQGTTNSLVFSFPPSPQQDCTPAWFGHHDNYLMPPSVIASRLGKDSRR